MTLTWVIIGVVLQACLAYMCFLWAVFAGCGVGNCKKLSKFQEKILLVALFGLPSISIFVAGMLIYQYNIGSSAQAYWWHSVSVACFCLYILYLIALNHFLEDRR